MIYKKDRGFHWYRKAWYSQPNEDRKIDFGIYPDGGDQGTTGEMTMHWHDLGGKLYPRLECFDDAWITLHSFYDLIKDLAAADNQNITEEQFVEILIRRGFRDLTAYDNPDKSKTPRVCEKCGRPLP